MVDQDKSAASRAAYWLRDRLNARGVSVEVGSAEKMPFADQSFDLILAIQVLEHVFDPIAATAEMYRCLRPGGRIVILVPQSGTLHLVPHHYQNITRFWLDEQTRRLGGTVELWQPIGGSWRTIASRLFLMFWPGLNLHATQDPALRRRPWTFWALMPLQVVVAAVFFPIAMLLSLGDIKEEANNHLFIISRPR